MHLAWRQVYGSGPVQGARGEWGPGGARKDRTLHFNAKFPNLKKYEAVKEKATWPGFGVPVSFCFPS